MFTNFIAKGRQKSTKEKVPIKICYLLHGSSTEQKQFTGKNKMQTIFQQ